MEKKYFQVVFVSIFLRKSYELIKLGSIIVVSRLSELNLKVYNWTIIFFSCYKGQKYTS